MNKNKKSKSPSKFLQTTNKAYNREIFADGDWLKIREDLALSGWGYSQREHIHFCLKQGIPLSIAVRKLAENQGSCPIYSKPFF